MPFSAPSTDLAAPAKGFTAPEDEIQKPAADALKPPGGFPTWEAYDAAGHQYDESMKSSDFIRAATDPKTGLLPTVGQGLQREGNLAVGALADIGTLPINTGESKFRNVKAAALDLPMPFEKEQKKLSAPLRAVAAGTQGLIKTAPQLAAAAADPLLGAAAFGTTPTGFDPKQAVLAGVLPIIGKYSGAITEAIASKAGVTKDAALAVLNKMGGAGGAAATIGADQAAQIFKLPKEQQRDAWIDAVGNVGSMFLLGATGERHQFGGKNETGTGNQGGADIRRNTPAIVGDIPTQDRLDAVNKQLSALEQRYGPREIFDEKKQRLVPNPDTIRPKQEDDLIKLRDQLNKQQQTESETENALRQQKTRTVLQRQPKQVGETGGERGRVEPGQL
jgi:hypothetical protein